MMNTIDSAARTGLATRALQTVDDWTDGAATPEIERCVAAFRGVEQDADRLGCGSLAAAARLACQVAKHADSDTDL